MMDAEVTDTYTSAGIALERDMKFTEEEEKENERVPNVSESQSEEVGTGESTNKDKQHSTSGRWRTGGLQLPLARVRSIMKSDPDITLASQDAVFVIAKVTELFTAHMAKTAYQYTVLSKRKTIQRKDVDSCVVHHDEMSFLEGMLDS